MRLFSLVVLFIAALFIVGCTTQPVVKDQPVKQPSTSVGDVDGIGKDATGLDTLDKDLDTSDLDNVEADLNVDF